MKINTANIRKYSPDLFKLSDILAYEVQKHHPFIVVSDNTVHVIYALKDVLKFPLATEVLWQWQGKWSSDFFIFTVWDLKEAYDEKQGVKHFHCNPEVKCRPPCMNCYPRTQE